MHYSLPAQQNTYSGADCINCAASFTARRASLEILTSAEIVCTVCESDNLAFFQLLFCFIEFALISFAARSSS